MNIAIIMVVIFLIMILAGIPLFFSMGFAGLIGINFLDNVTLGLLAKRIFHGLDSYTLMAIPFFIMAGDIMQKSGILKGLIDLSDLLVGHIYGGLAHINIVASMLFGGITGSAVADTASIGGMLIPAMVKQGYSKSFSAAVTATSSVVSPIIPPSMLVIFYAYAWNVSIGGLFLAGILPGILVGFSLLAVSYYISVKRKYPRRTEPIPFDKVKIILKESIWALIMPFIILGSVLTGIATATESAVVAIAYALFVGFFITRELKLKAIPEILLNAGKTTATIMVLVASANVISWILAERQMGTIVGEAILSFTQNPLIFLLMTNILFLITGFLLPPSSSIIIFIPMLAPIAHKLGISDIHYGILVVTNLCIGLATPPVGVCLYVASGIAKISMDEMLKDVIPFVIAEIIVLLLVTYVPVIGLWIPRMLGYA